MNPSRPRSPKKPGGVLFATFSQNSSPFSLARDPCAAQLQAAEWINGHPNLDLITINSCVTEHAAIVTVWYRTKIARSGGGQESDSQTPMP